MLQMDEKHNWLTDLTWELTAGTPAEDNSVTCSHQCSNSAAAPHRAQGWSETSDLPGLVLAQSEPAPGCSGVEGHDEDEEEGESAWLWVTACSVQWSVVV